MFFSIRYCIFCVYGVYIIPKWLIKVPGPVQYFLDDFGNFESLVKIWTRRSPNYYQHPLTKTRKFMESSLKLIIFISENLELDFLKCLKGTTTIFLKNIFDLVESNYIYIYILVCARAFHARECSPLC